MAVGVGGGGGGAFLIDIHVYPRGRMAGLQLKFLECGLHVVVGEAVFL